MMVLRLLHKVMAMMGKFVLKVKTGNRGKKYCRNLFSGMIDALAGPMHLE